jgi:hypothetical protein
LIGRNVDGSWQVQLAKLVCWKRFDKNGFLWMIELLLEFIAINFQSNAAADNSLNCLSGTDERSHGTFGEWTVKTLKHSVRCVIGTGPRQLRGDGVGPNDRAR